MAIEDIFVLLAFHAGPAEISLGAHHPIGSELIIVADGASKKDAARIVICPAMGVIGVGGHIVP